MIYYKIFVLLLLLFVSKIVFADIHDAPISKAVIESDKRLGSKVDIAYEKIYIGELLEEIKSSSGIDISASDKDKMAGIPIMIYMKDKTVASVMNALWSFISYNGAVCDWKVNGTGDNAKYIFIRPKTSIDLPGKLSDDIQSEFENHAKALLELAKSPEGKKNADTFESDFINRSSQRTRDGIATLAESLQEKDIDSLMKGKKTVTISIDQLSSKGRGFVEYAFKQASPKIVDPDTGAILQEVPFPKTIKIQVDNSSVPCLFIEIGDMGGHGYIGGRMFMDKQLEKISRDWMLPCDKKQNEILEKTLLSSKGSSNVPDKIKAIFDLKNISIISSPMDENDNKSLPDLNGGSLGDFLRDSKKSSKGIIYKWNNDVLLFSYFNWFKKEIESKRTSYYRLKDFLVTNKGKFIDGKMKELPDLESVCQLVEKCSLSEISNMNLDESFMGDIMNWNSLFKTLARRPEYLNKIQSGEGIPITGFANALRESLPTQPLIDKDISFRKMKITYRDVFLSEKSGSKPTLKMKSICLELMRPNKHPFLLPLISLSPVPIR